MNGGEVFVLCIIALAMGAGVIKHYLYARTRTPPAPRENPEYKNRITALERRVQTLERIVTEKGYDLKREFDEL